MFTCVEHAHIQCRITYLYCIQILSSFHCFVAEFCLLHLVTSKHPTVFYQHFVECIFFYNNYDKHKGRPFIVINSVYLICMQFYGVNNTTNSARVLHTVRYQLYYLAVYNKFKEPSRIRELFSLKGSMNVE